MPEEESLENEIKEVATEAALKAVKPVEFPEVQKVEVTNPQKTEKIDLSGVESQLKAILAETKKKPAPFDSGPLEDLLDEIREGLPPDNDATLKDILKAIERNKPTTTDFSELLDEIEKVVDAVKNIKITGYGGVGPSKVFSKQLKKLPGGGFGEVRADGLGFQTYDTLTNGETYDSGVLSLEGYTQVHTNVLSDVVGTITINFIRDAAGTDVLRTLTIPYATTDLNIYRTFAAPAFTPYVRYRFTADAAGQTDFYFDTKFLTKALSPQTLGLDAFISPQMVANLGRNILVGKTAGGTYSNVGITEQRALQVTPPAEGKTAFGETLIATLSHELLADFIYNINSEQVTSQANQSGSVTQANSMAKASTGAAANSSGTLFTKDRARYQPGHGTRARFTALFTTGVANSTQIAGIGDSANGFFFGYNGTDFGILHRRDGSPEVRTLTVTTASSDAEDITITLDGDAATDVTVTASGVITTTANEIAAHDYSDVGRGWVATAVGDTVIFTSWDSSVRTGTYSLSSATSAVGTFAQTVAGVAPTETWTAQADWNGEETFDGTGLTGETLDPTKGNVYQITYQWLGFGKISFFIEDPDTGEYHEVHVIQYANANTTPSLSSPTQPTMISAENSSNTSDISVQTGSMGAFTDGTSELIGPRFGVDASVTLGATSAETPFLTIRCKEVHQGKLNTNFIKILLAACSVEHSKPVSLVFYRNATLTGASFSDYSTNTSALQTDTSATSFSGGKQLFSVALGKTGNTIFDLSGDKFNGVIKAGDSVTVTIKPKSGNAAEATVSLNLVELF